MAPSAEPVPRLLVGDFDFAPEDRARIAAALDSHALLLVHGRAALRDALAAHPETDIVCSFFPPAETLELAPNLRWIALPSAGADYVLRAGLIRAGEPVVTTARGIHAAPISEFVFSMLLLWVRHWPQLLALQHAHDWPAQERRIALTARELDGATLGLIGLGAIGRRVAQLGRCFGMRVVATHRSASFGETDADVDELLPLDQLHTLLARADFVVIAVPSTPATQHLIGAPQLRAMKSSAFLINIARGRVIDEPALVEALRTDTIAGAGLDVFETEPLPPDSPLWDLPNVFISPHISGASPAYSRRFTDLLLENLARYRAGQPLRNVVSLERGY